MRRAFTLWWLAVGLTLWHTGGQHLQWALALHPRGCSLLDTLVAQGGWCSRAMLSMLSNACSQALGVWLSTTLQALGCTARCACVAAASGLTLTCVRRPGVAAEEGNPLLQCGERVRS